MAFGGGKIAVTPAGADNPRYAAGTATIDLSTINSFFW